jgi:hypothetical protein
MTIHGEYMGGHGIIAWIIISVIAGWLTGKLMKGSGFGFFMDMDTQTDEVSALYTVHHAAFVEICNGRLE